jgi:hypothetical protein
MIQRLLCLLGTHFPFERLLSVSKRINQEMRTKKESYVGSGRKANALKGREWNSLAWM